MIWKGKRAETFDWYNDRPVAWLRGITLSCCWGEINFQSATSAPTNRLLWLSMEKIEISTWKKKIEWNYLNSTNEWRCLMVNAVYKYRPTESIFLFRFFFDSTFEKAVAGDLELPCKNNMHNIVQTVLSQMPICRRESNQFLPFAKTFCIFIFNISISFQYV